MVHLLVRKTSSLAALDGCLERVTVHYHDGSTVGLVDVLAEVKPSIVYHVAAFATAEHGVEDVSRLIHSNVLFSTQLLEAMVRSGVSYLVNTETFWQHRDGADDYDPVCLYAATKQAFHDILLFYVRTGRIQALSLVLYDIYGPDDPRKKLFALLKESVKDGRQLSMTPGEQLVDITHVDDVTTAYLVAADLLQSGSCGELQSYCVTSGRRMTLRELIETITRETGLPIAPVWGEKSYRPNEVMVPWLGEVLPGWLPEIDLVEGMRRVFECDYDAH